MSETPLTEKMNQYVDLLMAANEKMNLTGAKTRDDFIKKHVEDVLRANKVLREEASLAPTKIIDVGSGGGVPGIPIAIEMNIETHLIERRLKKAGALEEIVESLQLKKQIKVHARSFEEIYKTIVTEECEVWFRGFLPGVKLGKYFSDHFSVTALPDIILMKGPAWPEELRAILADKSISREWKERFENCREFHYELSLDLGKRILVVI